ncbi:hypothetical protein B7494_g1895 [Chlorociboria aeruginascens]|nr:hypothetical protein B7494_g1895 [Chlorociboria aeruginascens]
MLPSVSVCRRAVQHQIPATSDSIWISDDAIATLFQRFCSNAKVTRRYGSFVPGPMESRRRSGKRRLTHLSETTPHPVSDGWSFGNILGGGDRSQWKWEAPTKPSPSKSPKSGVLPAWLADWGAYRQESWNPVVRNEVSNDKDPAQQSTYKDSQRNEDPQRFREALKLAAPEDLLQVHVDFNRKCKQELMLGLVSNESLYSTLRWVTEDLNTICPDPNPMASKHLSFYQAIWEGISTSKVFRPEDYEGRVLDRLLCYLGRLPNTTEVQVLADNIIRSIPAAQLHTLQKGLVSIVNAWSRSWFEKPPTLDADINLDTAIRAVTDAENDISNFHKVAMVLRNGPQFEKNIAMVREAKANVEKSLLIGATALLEAEHTTNLLSSSVENLASFLGCLPQDLASDVIIACSNHVTTQIANSKSKVPALEAFRYHWLSTLAQLPNIDRQLFTSTWQTMETLKANKQLETGQTMLNPTKPNEINNLIINHWISQGYVSKTTATWNRFEATLSPYRYHTFGLLLRVIEMRHKYGWIMLEELFSFFNQLGRHNIIYLILRQSKSLGLDISARVLGPVIEIMSNHDLNYAFRTYKLYPSLGLDHSPISCPRLIIAMINDPQFTPRTIWAMLENPIKPAVFSRSRLPQHRIRLIQDMAMAFARAESRHTRVVVRNVEQCLRYLSMRKVPITSTLTRAVAYTVVTRDFNNDQFVVTNRLKWALGLIARVEGDPVAVAIDKLVFQWRADLVNQSMRVKREKEVLREIQRIWWRECNVLRVGTID